ncbi:SPL family radical SAM protein [Methanocella paludicola]|nr:radical SAM protein [Methanocella paludicola]
MSGLPGLDYTLNPYMGCGHACIYCYAPSTLRYAGPDAWGSFVNVKADIPRVLEKEVRTKKRGVVGISTVTDPYQPVEEKYRLTRSCLKVLLAKDLPICVQTKSALVVRDIDLLREFKDKEVGFTVTTLDERMSGIMEPGASKPAARLDALKTLSDNGIATWAFVGPMVPGIIDKERLEELLARVQEAGASHVMLDRLRLKPGLWGRMEPILMEKAPDIAEACKRALFKNDGTFEALRSDAARICLELKLPCELNY